MKIEIDLNDVLTEEYGPSESLAESVHRQVVEAVKRDVSSKIQTRIDVETGKVVSEIIKKEVESKLPEFVANLFDAPYTVVSRYGEKGATTTFRAEYLKMLNQEMQYKKTSYASERNIFTKAVDDMVESEIAKFKKEYSSIVTKEFAAQVINQAAEDLRKKLNL